MTPKERAEGVVVELSLGWPRSVVALAAIERAIAEAVAEETERCAAVADKTVYACKSDDLYPAHYLEQAVTAEAIAKAIRARAKVTP